ncbi:hypothetical protein TNCV_2952891 [Trichonephila clavipes]|nr:hypothetical protein TNCV_2952891 [Trichonephila clavipes]
MQASHRRRRGCRTLANTPGISWISPATTAILDGARVNKTLHMAPEEERPRQERSAERTSQFIGPPRPIHRPGYTVSNALGTSALKCASAPSCWNHK